MFLDFKYNGKIDLSLNQEKLALTIIILYLAYESRIYCKIFRPIPNSPFHKIKIKFEKVRAVKIVICEMHKAMSQTKLTDAIGTIQR